MPLETMAMQAENEKNTSNQNHLNLHLSETVLPDGDEGGGAILAIVHENDPR
jgi:hypothetical protein